MNRPVRFALLLTMVFAVARLGAAEPAELLSLRTKAEQGNSLAQYNLGLAYAQGQQVPVDLPQAFMWLSLASENGSTGKALDLVLGDINDQQLAEGRRLLAANRTAFAPRTPVPTMSRSNFRKLANRGFSLTPRSDAADSKPAHAVAPAPSPVSSPVEPDELTQIKAENSQLKADLVRATSQIREQAESIAKLQDELAGKSRAVVSTGQLNSGQPSSSAGLVAGGPIR